MESPSRRSVSRGRSRSAEDNRRYQSGSPDYRANGGSDRSRSRVRDRSISKSRSRSPLPAPKSCKIVIEKLTKNVHEEHLREIFGVYGEIEELEMPVNRQFMTNKGIAYILYTKAAFAEDAISRMHEAQLDGAMISVSIVLPRRRFDRSPPPMRPKTGGFGEPHRLTAGARAPPPDRSYGRPPPTRRSPVYGGRGPRRDSPDRDYGGRGGRGGGFRDRPVDDYPRYRQRSFSRDRSPPYRRSRSPRRVPERNPVRERSVTGTPPRRERSPPRSGGARRRRSPSYSSYGSQSPNRSQSRSRRR